MKGFKQFSQAELNLDEEYLMYRYNGVTSTKLYKKDNTLYTSFGLLKADTAFLRPFSDVKDTEVEYEGYRGLLKGLLPVVTTEDVKWGGMLKHYPSYENYYFARVYWFGGQKMIPHSWVKLNKLKFLCDV